VEKQMIKLVILSLLFSFSVSAKKALVKKGKAEVDINFNLYKDFEIKSNFLNTPVMIWHKSLKHHGPTVGIFPYKKAPKGFASNKAIKTNFEKYKKEETKQLKTLKARSFKFFEPKVVGSTLRFSMSYKIQNIKLYATQTNKLCKKNKGIKIKTLLKGEQLKEFEPILLKMVDELKCN
jgi:hypothetical protein